MISSSSSEPATAMDEVNALKAKVDELEAEVAEYKAELRTASTTGDRKTLLETVIIPPKETQLTALRNELTELRKKENILLQQSASGKNCISRCILVYCAVWWFTLNSIVRFAECANYLMFA